MIFLIRHSFYLSGNIVVSSGMGSRTSSGDVQIYTSDSNTNGVSGVMDLFTGVAATGNSGYIALNTGQSASGRGGDIDLLVGVGNSGNGGNVFMIGEINFILPQIL